MSDASFTFATTAIEAAFIAMGLIGNVLSIIVFSRKTFRNNSISTYCIALAIIESITAVEFVICVYNLAYNINLPDQSVSLCKFTFSIAIYMNAIQPWIIVAFSIDKILSMRTRSIPILKKKWFQWSIVAGIVLFNLALYIYIPILIRIAEIFPGYFMCDLSTIGFFNIYMLSNILSTCLIPFLAMLITSILTIRLLIKSRKSIEKSGHLTKDRKSRDRKYAITSLTFNITFIVLKAPVATFFLMSAYFSYFNLYFYRISFILFFLDMSISFFIHSITNSLFRREILVLLRLKRSPEILSNTNSRTNGSIRLNQVSTL